MKLQKVLGATSEIWQVFIQDSSKSDGSGLAGLTNASVGLTAYYHRDTDTTATAIALVSMTVGTFTTRGFKEIDPVNMPGWYQFCPPDAALAAGAKSVGIQLKGATSMAPLAMEVQLLAVNIDDAVRMGMTALPNAAAGANGGLPLGDASGRVDLGKWLGTAASTPTVAGVPNVNAKTWNDLATVALPLVPATAGRSLVVDAAGLADATMVKAGPTGSGTAQTARDLGAQLDAAVTTRMATFTLPTNFSALVIDSTGRVNAFLIGILTTVFTEGATGRVAAAFKQFFNIASPAATMDHGVLVDTATNLTNSVTVSDKTGFSLSAAGVQAIWDALTSALVTAGSIGKWILDKLDAAVSSRSTFAGGAVASVTAPVALTAAYDLAKTAAQAGDAMTLTAAYNAAKTASQAGDAMALVDGAITAAKLAADAITAAKVAADVSQEIRAEMDANSTQLAALVARLTSTRAGYLDNLSAGAVAQQATLALVKASTDALPSDPADESLIIAATNAIASAIAALNNLSAADIRTAVGLAGATLDTQLDALPTNAELATALASADDATLAAIAALLIPTAAQNATALLDSADGVESGLTPRQALRLIAAAAAGKLSGAATTTVVLRNAAADSKDRITATVDADGNRSAVTLDLSS